jgi:hypothetical protein
MELALCQDGTGLGHDIYHGWASETGMARGGPSETMKMGRPSAGGGLDGVSGPPGGVNPLVPIFGTKHAPPRPHSRLPLSESLRPQPDLPRKVRPSSAHSRRLSCPLAPRIRFLYIGSRVCSTLLSDPTSRRRPCASTNPSPPSGWVKNFHLQTAEHARHTTPGAVGRCRSGPNGFCRQGCPVREAFAVVTQGFTGLRPGIGGK